MEQLEKLHGDAPFSSHPDRRIDRLVQAGSNYFLNPVDGGTGPELQRGGAPMTVGEYGAWTPIGAAHLAGGGYDVAWHDPGSGQYTVWSVDANGNYLSNVIGAVSGTSTALESLEATFGQDLNGDGVVGIPPAATEAGMDRIVIHAAQIDLIRAC